MFTELQLEMINYRLEAPDAMAEVLAEELPLNYELAFELVTDRMGLLIEAVLCGWELDLIDIYMLKDISTDRVYVDIAAETLHEHIDGPGSPVMTHQKLSGIRKSHENLVDKLKTIILFAEKLNDISRTVIG